MLGIYQLFVFVNFVLLLVALFQLINLKLQGADKLLWAIIVIIVPIVGSILFFIWKWRRSRVRDGDQSEAYDLYFYFCFNSCFTIFKSG